jgi:tRNA modification GTPase
MELLGMVRTAEVAASADDIWIVVDGHEGLAPEDRVWRERLGKTVLVQNKCDLGCMEPLEPGAIVVSAKTGEGLERLIDRVTTRLESAPGEAVWINDRHQPLLASARDHLHGAMATLGQDLPTDLVSVHLSAALQDLGLITGESASEDMLERIFRDFCIGK